MIMKKIIGLIILSVFFLSGGSQTLNADNEITCRLSFEHPAASGGSEQDEIPKIIDPDKGRRTSAWYFLCNISCETGVDIQGIDDFVVLSYEMADESGVTLGIFTDEAEFVQTLYSVSGNWRISIHAEEYTLTGYVSL